MADTPARPEPEVAIVFSPEPWVGELHRHLVDHGGARVREIVMDQRLALEDEYEVLVVSHRWPALTRSFVKQLHEGGRTLLGVFDGDEPTGRVFLANLGVDGVVAGNAPMTEFLQAIAVIAPDARREPTGIPSPANDESSRERDRDHGQIVVVGGPPGAGRTEIACALHAAHPSSAAILIDADDAAPAIAQRLGLPVEPNLRTAIDATAFGLGDVDATMHPTPNGPVLCGLPNVAAWAQLRPTDVVDLVRELAHLHPGVIVDIGAAITALDSAPRGRNELARALLEAADRIVLVALAQPVGVARALAWAAELRAIVPDPDLHGVINCAAPDRFRRAECADELRHSVALASLHTIPRDRRVERAHWEGASVGRSAFTRAIADIAAVVFAATPDDEAVIDLTHDDPVDRTVSALEATA